MKVAIQGDKGSNHHVLTSKLFGDYVDLYCAKTFLEVFSAVETFKADIGVIAVENSIVGTILQNLDLLSKHQLEVVAEGYLRIEHCLIGIPGARLGQIRAAYSHEMALKQCTVFLEKHAIEQREYHDTAAAVPYVMNSGDPSIAAIAPFAAAELYGMEVISQGIETNKVNFTRFIVLSSPAKKYEITKFLHNSNDVNKAMIYFETNHELGALASTLTLLAAASFNLTRIESRPLIGKAWRYVFYCDFVTELEEADIRKRLTLFQNELKNLRIFGIFPQGQIL